MRSLRYGTTIDHVLELDLALSTGEVLNMGTLDEAQYAAKCALRDREGEIYRVMRRLTEKNRDEIDKRFPKVKRKSGGYAFDSYQSPLPWNMTKIVCGSEGTLGLVLEAKVNLEPLPRHAGLCVAHFTDLDECLRSVVHVVSHEPSAVELMDRMVLDLARENLLTRDLMGFLEGHPAAILIIEAMGDTEGEVRGTLERIAADLRGRGMGYAYPVMLDEASQRGIWLMRTNGLGLMNRVKGERKPVPFIEDGTVRVDDLAEYIAGVQEICRRHDRPVSIYAHASVGLLHVRPMLDLHARAEVDELKRISDEVFDLVVSYGGSISGEHGDGLIRSSYNERFFGPKLLLATIPPMLARLLVAGSGVK